MKIYCPPVKKQSVFAPLYGRVQKLKQWSRFFSFVSVPVFRGHLRGNRWTLSSRGKLLRILSGTYENEQTGLFVNRLRPGDVLFDIGANVGYYTLLSAKIVGRWGRVFSFEPVPNNVYHLKKHVALNHFQNVKIFDCALGDVTKRVRFSSDTGTGTGSISDAGNLEVSMRTLDEIVQEQDVLPTHIKMDVEGAEVKALRGAQRTLQQARPLLFLSTHGLESKRSCLAFLASLSYLVETIDGDCLENSDELYCYPRELAGSSRRLAA